MRQKFLGKEEWIADDIEDAYEEEVKPLEANEVEDNTE